MRIQSILKVCRQSKLLVTQNILCKQSRGLSSKRLELSSYNNEGIANLRSELNSPNTNLDWKLIRKNIIDTQKHINEVNIDATILGICSSSENLEAAKNYVDYLKSEGFALNYATIGRLIKIYYLSYKNGVLGEHDKQEILKRYKEIRAQHPMLDGTTCENFIHGLVATDEWKTAVELINMTKITGTPSSQAYSLIAARAFQDKAEFKLGWEVLRDMTGNNRLPKCEVYSEYFKTIRKYPETFRELLEDILRFVGENKIVLSFAVINELHKILKEFNCTSTTAKISKIGQCSNCKKKLKSVSIGKEEFELLTSSFLEKVIIRKDVFQKSSPQEINKFIKFVERNRPFECVIDGLNVAFSSGVKKSPTVYAKLISSVVKKLSEEGQRLLIIGRKHMQKWPKGQMSFIQQNAKVFYADDLTQDDPLLLYAALKSGPKTNIVSRDLMRSHAHILGPELKDIFRRWQQEHQYQLLTTNKDGEAILLAPIKYNLNAHKVENVWHIPYREEYSATPGDSFEIPSSWLCFSIN